LLRGNRIEVLREREREREREKAAVLCILLEMSIGINNAHLMT